MHGHEETVNQLDCSLNTLKKGGQRPGGCRSVLGTLVNTCICELNSICWWSPTLQVKISISAVVRRRQWTKTGEIFFSVIKHKQFNVRLYFSLLFKRCLESTEGLLRRKVTFLTFGLNLPPYCHCGSVGSTSDSLAVWCSAAVKRTKRWRFRSSDLHQMSVWILKSGFCSIMFQKAILCVFSYSDTM